jgi:uncharacterized RDD family membrane protein YckC
VTVIEQPAAQPREQYAGFVTRAVALGLDFVAINAIAFAVTGAASLVGTWLGGNGSLDPIEAVAGGFLWIGWIVLYFTTFWALTGQTPGSRVMRIRVVGEPREDVRSVQALIRFAGMVLSAIPLGAGFLAVLVDDRRRGWHDRIAHTVVRWDDGPPPRHVRKQRFLGGAGAPDQPPPTPEQPPTAEQPAVGGEVSIT